MGPPPRLLLFRILRRIYFSLKEGMRGEYKGSGGVESKWLAPGGGKAKKEPSFVIQVTISLFSGEHTQHF